MEGSPLIELQDVRNDYYTTYALLLPAGCFMLSARFNGLNVFDSAELLIDEMDINKDDFGNEVFHNIDLRKTSVVLSLVNCDQINIDDCTPHLYWIQQEQSEFNPNIYQLIIKYCHNGREDIEKHYEDMYPGSRLRIISRIDFKCGSINGLTVNEMTSTSQEIVNFFLRMRDTLYQNITS